MRILAFLQQNKRGSVVGGLIFIVASAVLIAMAETEGGGEAYRVLLLLYWPLSLVVGTVAGFAFGWLPGGLGWLLGIVLILTGGLIIWVVLGAIFESLALRAWRLRKRP